MEGPRFKSLRFQVELRLGLEFLLFGQLLYGHTNMYLSYDLNPSVSVPIGQAEDLKILLRISTGNALGPIASTMDEPKFCPALEFSDFRLSRNIQQDHDIEHQHQT